MTDSRRYPFGYAGVPQGMGTMLTRVELEAKQTVYKLHPEFWRRTIALMEFAFQKGVPLGVGEGWRVQPDPPPAGFAPAGNSNHEGFPADGVCGGAVAIDMVPDASWDWMEDNCAAYGLRTFRQPSASGYSGNDEPWHIQPAEIPASRSYRSEPWDLAVWPLPGDEEDDMALTDDDVARIAKAVWDEVIQGDQPDEAKPARWRLRQIQGMCRHYLGGWKESTPAPEQSLLKKIDEQTR